MSCCGGHGWGAVGGCACTCLPKLIVRVMSAGGWEGPAFGLRLTMMVVGLVTGLPGRYMCW